MPAEKPRPTGESFPSSRSEIRSRLTFFAPETFASLHQWVLNAGPDAGTPATGALFGRIGNCAIYKISVNILRDSLKF
jgi:hypothetical protein